MTQEERAVEQMRAVERYKDLTQHVALLQARLTRIGREQTVLGGALQGLHLGYQISIQASTITIENLNPALATGADVSVSRDSFDMESLARTLSELATLEGEHRRLRELLDAAGLLHLG
ncbi:MAG: hypothetical protein HYU53_17020 [Acidobacteria bacterium]|nr:hypothetical protein [Acidobacteriota bacterium]